MAKNLCSTQGIPPKIGQNVLKGYKLKVVKLGWHSLRRSAVV